MYFDRLQQEGFTSAMYQRAEHALPGFNQRFNILTSELAVSTGTVVTKIESLEGTFAERLAALERGLVSMEQRIRSEERVRGHLRTVLTGTQGIMNEIETTGGAQARPSVLSVREEGEVSTFVGIRRCCSVSPAL